MQIFLQLLLNPAIIALALGIAFGIASRFKLPAVITELISGYLIFSIGFKGGACLGVANECTLPLFELTVAGALIGFFQPFLNYLILKSTTKLDNQTRAVVACEYGSISIVTFITAISFLHEQFIPYDTFMTATAGIMEIPALVSGLWLLQRHQQRQTSWLSSIRAIMSCKQISFIFLGFAAGAFYRMYLPEQISSYLLWPFTYALVIFMFDIGRKIANQRSAIAQFSIPLFGFGLYMPIIYGCLGAILAMYLVGHLGSAVLFAVLLASASYIAVPAVMIKEAKEAQEAIYLPLALGITLPFNVLLGIPVYYKLAKAFLFWAQ